MDCLFSKAGVVVATAGKYMFRRLFLLVTCAALLIFGLKKYLADRVHRFIFKCLTAEETSIIMDDDVNSLVQDRIVNEGW